MLAPRLAETATAGPAMRQTMRHIREAATSTPRRGSAQLTATSRLTCLFFVIGTNTGTQCEKNN